MAILYFITQKLKMACIREYVYFLNFTGVTYCSNLVYSNEIKEINMSSYTCHAEKYNSALNSDPSKFLVVYLVPFGYHFFIQPIV